MSWPEKATALAETRGRDIYDPWMTPTGAMLKPVLTAFTSSLSSSSILIHYCDCLSQAILDRAVACRDLAHICHLNNPIPTERSTSAFGVQLNFNRPTQTNIQD
jgi:hypothetical protein